VSRLLVALGLLGLAVAAARAERVPRFFVEGDGALALTNAHTGARAVVRYRRPDGAYDPDAIARIRRAFRSKGDRSEGLVSLRLVEVLSWVQGRTGGKPLTLLSGYRNPTYNENLRRRGAKAAGGSLHTEGLAADLALAGPQALRLWHAVRDLDCCGAGYYARQGFVHVDVGRARFWEAATSRVDEDLSAGNARLFARTEFDRYAPGEPITVTLHALTVPPVRIARAARLVSAAGEEVPLVLGGDLAEHEGCLEAPATSTRLRAAGPPRAVAGRLVLSTCEPRGERTPATVETNPIEIR
jgi:uncharacterized protein YcbK (DUF882 family)